MSKDNTESKNQEQEAPKKEQTLESYFFPNVGEGTAFSVEAPNAKEAAEANTKHLKEAK